MKKSELAQKMRNLANLDSPQLMNMMNNAGMENSSVIEGLPMVSRGLNRLAIKLIRKPKDIDGEEILDIGRHTLDFNFGLRTWSDAKAVAHPQLFLKALKFGEEVMACLRECKEIILAEPGRDKPKSR